MATASLDKQVEMVTVVGGIEVPFGRHNVLNPRPTGTLFVYDREE
jgi:hypothetical protein